jgi:hypothetical protein
MKSLRYIHLPGVEGFEPTNGGVKVRSLTTWRHPTIIRIINKFKIGQEGIRTPDTVVRSHVL